MSSKSKIITTRESSSTESLKRKSIDKSDLENFSPNQEEPDEKGNIKKSRVRLRSSTLQQNQGEVSTTQDNKKSSLSSSNVKTRTALPRYGNSKSISLAEAKRRAATEKTSAERSQTTTSSSSSSSSSITASATSTAISTMASVATAITSSLLAASPSRLNSSLIPSSSSLSSSSTSTSSTPITKNSINIPLSKSTANRRRSTRKSLLKINEGRIKAYFDSCSLIDEEKLNETINPKLRTKCKWDYRDKANRQGEVINELKNAYRQNLNEVKSLQEKCESEEKILQDLIYDLRKELQETVHSNVELKKNETQLKKDYARLSHEYNSCNSKYKALEKEMPTILRELEFFKQKSDENDKYMVSLLEKLRTKEVIVDDLTSQLEILKAEKIELSTNLKDTVDTATEKYREEILQLRIELEKRQYDVVKTSAEREDMQEKVESHKEIVMTLESKLREAETLIQRLEKDETKQSQEISELKLQIIQKDNDFRMTLTSLQEYQRNSTEERATLRSEIGILQAKLSQIEESNMRDKFDLASKREEVQNLYKEVNNLRENLQSTQSLLSEREKEIFATKEAMLQLGVEKEMRIRSEMREEAERTERIAACAQLLATQYDCANRLKESDEKIKSTIDNLEKQIIDVKIGRDNEMARCQQLIDKIAILEGEISQYKHALENAHAEANYEAVAELGRVKGEVEVLRMRINELNEHKNVEGNAAQIRIRELEAQLAEKDLQRRKLHNLVQELRGNVRVFARVRPFLPDDEDFDPNLPPESSIATRHDNSGLKIIKRPKTPSDKPEEHTFTFDKVFGQSSSQELVFQEVSEFVQSALDGYHVCLFSYGQTGSGKTYTMQGSGDGPMRGIIPRAIQQVGLYKLSQEQKGWVYEMEVSFIEIYNETIKDLLRGDSQEDMNLKHEIKKDAAGNTYVSDIVMLQLDPNDATRVDEIMQLAARHRSVGQTSMNAQSSRSHSIFTLHLKAKNIADGNILKGALNLVDLAGSERLDRSGAIGSQMRETLAINKSLSSLTDVFVAIANKQTHIPFRNSKLTHLLQPALSGEGKALMMVNLSPTEQSYYESLCSLRFASQVNQCELGKPKRFLKEANSLPTTSSIPVSKSSGTSSIPQSKTTTSSLKSSTSFSSSTTSTTPSRPGKISRLK